MASNRAASTTEDFESRSSSSDLDNYESPDKQPAQGLPVPAIVKFAYDDFCLQSNGRKWSAKCNKCNKILSEKRGVTSAFIK